MVVPATNLMILLGLPKVSGKAAKVTGTTIQKSGLKGIETEKREFARRLTRPIETKAISIAEVPRITETGFGPFKRSIVAPSALEVKTQTAVLKIPGISSRKTYQQNYNIIRDYNRNL